MQKVINVKHYKPFKVLYASDKEIRVLSFQMRQDYLEFKGKPLKRQVTEYMLDYIEYQFVQVNDKWLLHSYDRKPSDKKLFKYLFKK